MANHIYSNQGGSTLSADITSNQTTLNVVDANSFPTIGAGETFLIVLENTARTVFEVCECTAINKGTGQLTITRAQEGTTGQIFVTGDYVENRLTKGTLENFIQSLLTADGDLLTYNATQYARLPIGTEGQYMRVVNGLPSWETVIDITGLPYNFDAASIDTAADPGSGNLRMNAAGFSGVSQLAINNVISTGVNLSSYLLSILDGSPIYIRDDADPTKTGEYTVDGDPIDQTTFVQINVIYVADQGGGTPADAAPIHLITTGLGQSLPTVTKTFRTPHAFLYAGDIADGQTILPFWAVKDIGQTLKLIEARTILQQGSINATIVVAGVPLTGVWAGISITTSPGVVGTPGVDDVVLNNGDRIEISVTGGAATPQDLSFEFVFESTV